MTAPPRLIVLPRWKVHALDVPHVVVSITDPPPFGKPGTLSYAPRRLSVGHWAFADVQGEDHPMAMTLDHAREIWAFVERWRAVEAIIVCCNAGASRSPSIAMAIADRWRLGRGCIDWAGLEHAAEFGPPNPLVYERMMEGAG